MPRPEQQRSESDRQRFAILLAAGAVLLTAPRLYFHELFRDEAWTWIVVLENRTLPQLFEGLNRTGEGYLFPLLCWLASHLSTAFQAMQAVNLAIVGANAFVIGRWAPFRAAERTMLVFGYFYFYEYAVISRHYALGVLLASLACVAASRASAIGLGLALGLMCQTTVYGYIVAFAIGAGFLIQRWRGRREIEAFSRHAAIAGVLLFGAGAIAGVTQFIPEPGTTFAVGWRTHWDPAQALAMLRLPWHAFFPVPRLQLEFWNSDLLQLWPFWQGVAGIAFLLLAVAILWRRKLALMVFGIGGIGLLLFAYGKYIGTLRHHGHWWVLFIVSLWLAGGLGREGARRTLREWSLVALLIVHCGAMVFASVVDLQQPFSNGARTAEFIRSHGLDRYPLFGYREPPAAPVSLALGKPLYAPSRRMFATHTEWGPLQRDLSLEEVRCSARQLARQEGSDIVMVMNSELPSWPEVESEGAVTGAILGTENYFLYRLKSAALTAENGDCIQEQH